MAESNGSAGGDKGSEKLKVGDKEYSAQDVEALLTQMRSIQSKEESLSELIKMSEAIGMEPGEFGKQGVAALTVINNLLDKGVIDEKGNLVEKKAQDKDNKGLDDIFNLNDKGKDKDKMAASSVEEIVAKAIGPVMESIKGFESKITGIEDVQTSMLRSSYSDQIRGKYPELTDEDVAKVFGVAMSDKTKSLWEHAKTVAEAKSSARAEIEKEFAKKHGLDYDKMNENRLKEQSGEGGAPPGPGEGKKISWRGVDDNAVDPADLAAEYFKSKGF